MLAPHSAAPRSGLGWSLGDQLPRFPWRAEWGPIGSRSDAAIAQALERLQRTRARLPPLPWLLDFPPGCPSGVELPRFADATGRTLSPALEAAAEKARLARPPESATAQRPKPIPRCKINSVPNQLGA